MSWRRKWQPTLVFLPGKSHGQWNLVGYSPWGRKESDTNEQLHFHFSFTMEDNLFFTLASWRPKTDCCFMSWKLFQEIWIKTEKKKKEKTICQKTKMCSRTTQKSLRNQQQPSVNNTQHVVKVLAAQSWPALWDPMDCSLPGSSVHGILQARILEEVAIPFSRGSSQPRDRTQVSSIAGRFFTIWVIREAPERSGCLSSVC